MIVMTNGHAPAPTEIPPQVVQLVLPRRVSRVLGYLVAALLGGAIILVALVAHTVWEMRRERETV